MKQLSLALALALAACGGGNKQVAARSTPAATLAGGIELAELRFYEGDELGAQLHANGRLEVKERDSAISDTQSWHDVGAIAVDGTISRVDGQKHAEVKSDGTVVHEGGQVAPFRLEGATLVVAHRKLTIDDKGILQGGIDTGKPLRIEGATTPGLKRTALVLFAIIMSSSDPDPAPDPAS
jgi:hypothetical protein